jgi:type III secretory pathway component EscT
MAAAVGLPAAWAASDAALGRLVAGAGLAAARALPIAWLVPVFGGPRAGGATRVGLGLALAALALPRLLPGLGLDVAAGVAGSAAGRIGPVAWLLVLAREAAIGATLGLVVSAAFRAAEAAGGLADRLGAGAAFASDGPGTDGDGGPMAQLYLLLAIVIFLEIGGLGRLAAALSRSYDAVPPGLAPAAGPTRALAGVSAVVVLASARLIESAVGLAAPVIVASLLADGAVGAIARLLPRAPAASASALIPAKALLSLGAVLAGLGVLDAALARGFPGWLDLAERALTSWR